MAAGRNIAVIGAGVGGLSAAIALRTGGHNVTLFERFTTPQPVGSGLMLQPTGLAALRRLGLHHDITERGARIDRLQGVTDRGRTIFDLTYADLDPNLHAVAVHRAALHAILWDAFAGSGARLETGRDIRETAPCPDGRVALIDTVGRFWGTFDLVVDASGANSPLRAQVTNARARQFAYGAVWANVPDIGLAPRTLAQRYIGAHVMLGHLRIGRIRPGGPPLAALFWSLKPEEYDSWAARFDGWREDVARLWPEMTPILAGLTGPRDFTLAAYQHFTAPQPQRGAVALIGDAAHATSPQLGQGANNAMLDALALADAVSAHRDIGAALAEYARNRRRHVRFYQRASAVMTPFFQSDSRVAGGIRDATFHKMRHVPYLRREMVRTLAGLKTGLFTHADAAILAGG